MPGYIKDGNDNDFNPKNTVDKVMYSKDKSLKQAYDEGLIDGLNDNVFKELLVNILLSSTYVDNQSININNLINHLNVKNYGKWAIVYNIDELTPTNTTWFVNNGESYETTLNGNTESADIFVYMNGENITGTALLGNTISIPEVNGNVIISNTIFDPEKIAPYLPEDYEFHFDFRNGNNYSDGIVTAQNGYKFEPEWNSNKSKLNFSKYGAANCRRYFVKDSDNNTDVLSKDSYTVCFAFFHSKYEFAGMYDDPILAPLYFSYYGNNDYGKGFAINVYDNTGNCHIILLPKTYNILILKYNCIKRFLSVWCNGKNIANIADVDENNTSMSMYKFATNYIGYKSNKYAITSMSAWDRCLSTEETIGLYKYIDNLVPDKSDKTNTWYNGCIANAIDFRSIIRAGHYFDYNKLISITKDGILCNTIHYLCCGSDQSYHNTIDIFLFKIKDYLSSDIILANTPVYSITISTNNELKITNKTDNTTSGSILTLNIDEFIPLFIFVDSDTYKIHVFYKDKIIYTCSSSSEFLRTNADDNYDIVITSGNEIYITEYIRYSMGMIMSNDAVFFNTILENFEIETNNTTDITVGDLASDWSSKNNFNDSIITITDTKYTINGITTEINSTSNNITSDKFGIKSSDSVTFSIPKTQNISTSGDYTVAILAYNLSPGIWLTNNIGISTNCGFVCVNGNCTGNNSDTGMVSNNYNITTNYIEFVYVVKDSKITNYINGVNVGGDNSIIPENSEKININIPSGGAYLTSVITYDRAISEDEVYAISKYFGTLEVDLPISDS